MHYGHILFEARLFKFHLAKMSLTCMVCWWLGFVSIQDVDVHVSVTDFSLYNIASCFDCLR